MNIDDAVDKLSAHLKGWENRSITSGRQSAVDCINALVLAIDRKVEVLLDSKEGLVKAKKISAVADIDQLEKVLDAVKQISEAIQRL